MILDKRTTKLMDGLLQICGEDGAYKIIEIAEMQRILQKYKVGTDELNHMLRFLSAGDMIDIKHVDETVYCLAILPKGRIHEEAQARKEQNRVLGKGMVFLLVFGSFLAAVVGAVIGGILGGILD